MRQAASVRDLYQPRLRVEAFSLHRSCGASLRWTAEGGCPYASFDNYFSRARVPAVIRSCSRIMFIDEAKIRVKAGDGGNGCMAFRREKFVPRGGRSGRDGGKGGAIVMESSERHNTLVHFRFNPEHTAQRGRHGEGSNKTGRDGEGVSLKVP